MILLLAACTRPSVDPDPWTPGPPSTTPSEPEPTVPVDVRSASCTPDPENAVRASCAIALSGAAIAEIALTDGAESVVFATDVAVTEAVVPVWGLVADTSWSWVARAAGATGATISGELTTGSLPPEMLFQTNPTGAGPSTVVHLLAPVSCGIAGRIAVFDGDGRVRWYQRLAADDQRIKALQYTEDGTMLVEGEHLVLAEVDLAGTELLRRDDFALPIHHDVFRRNGLTWVLMADAYLEGDGETYVEEIVVSLDAAGDEVWRWEEHGAIDATRAKRGDGGYWRDEFPGAIDAWHTNGLYPTEDGDVLVSLRAEDTIFRLSGSTGEIEWAFNGDGVGDAIPSDVTFVSGDPGNPRFHDQHDPALLPNGHLTLFDNGHVRGLELDLDQTALTASYVAGWPMGDFGCPAQGSVFELPDDHRIVTCATQHVSIEFDGQGTEVGRFTLTCPASEPPLTAKVQPLDLWAGHAAGVSARRE